MRDDVRKALAINESSTTEEYTIDITTTGRRSGMARRIEICFYYLDGSVYLSGLPASRPRDWLTNLTADPRLTFHLKHGVVADLLAAATVITNPMERRRVLMSVVDDYNDRNGADSPWPRAELEEWVALSPLAKIAFETD